MKGHDMFVMFGIMMLSSLLSTMNVWADQWSDIRWSLNDVYMGILMSGWMLLFMGVWYNMLTYIGFGICFVLLAIALIRTQLFITTNQYKLGMIPHHSMAVFMTNKLLQKSQNLPTNIDTLAKQIVVNQRRERDILKEKN